MGRLNARRVVVLVAALAMAALTARLGFWQLDRAGQKERLQASINERRDLPVLPGTALALQPGEAVAQHHRRIELRGHWLTQHTVFLENRQMLGRPGFFVLTPLQLPDGSAVVVQRGWLPRDLMDRTRVAAPEPPPGEVLISGRIAPPPARLYDFQGGSSGAIRQNLDLQAFGAETGLRLRPLSVLEAEPEPSARAAGGGDGLARAWPAPAADVHKHYGYAFQWFALSTLTVILYVWFQVLRPRRRPA